MTEEEKMKEITDIKRFLESEGFCFKKSLGQNFLIDNTVCPKMAEACADKNTGILEIGPGAGVLTIALAKRAKRVVALEIDKTLKPVLAKTLEGLDNAEVIFNDVLKTDIGALVSEKFSDCEKIAVCANLPYYITSKIIMYLIKSGAPFSAITVMVQKEVADRICANVGTRQAGLFTAQVDFYAKAEKLFEVKRGSFLPSPNVDSAVIKLRLRDTPKVAVKDQKSFFSLLSAAFSQRRKTLVNAVSNNMGIEKSILSGYLEEMNLSPSIRGEALTLEQLAELSNKMQGSNIIN